MAPRLAAKAAATDGKAGLRRLIQAAEAAFAVSSPPVHGPGSSHAEQYVASL